MDYWSRILRSFRSTGVPVWASLLLPLAAAVPAAHAATISGHITLPDSGLANVDICANGPTSNCVTSDDNGSYTLTDLQPGTYTVTLALQNYAFESATGTATVTLTDTQQAVEDFHACKEGQPFSGALYEGALVRGAVNVEITVDGAAYTTDSAGNFSIDGLSCGVHTITAPNLPDYFPIDARWDTFRSWSVNIPYARLDTVFGLSSDSGYAGNTVNTVTGNYTTSSTDLTLPGIGLPFKFTRTYNSQAATSQSARVGPLGYGWSDTYDLYLIANGFGDIRVYRGDGHSEIFAHDNAGDYVPQYGVFDQLTQSSSDGTFTLTDHGIHYHFDGNNLLHTITDPYGNQMTLTRDSSGLLTQITDTAGRAFTFTNDSNGHLQTISGPAGRSVDFTYDAAGNLYQVKDPLGNTTTYAYDGAHRLVSVTDGRNIKTVTNTYGAYDLVLDVVTAQQDGNGNITTFSYGNLNAQVFHEPEPQTIVTDPLQHSEMYGYDALLRLDSLTDKRGHAQYRRYGNNGKVSSITDKRGYTTAYTYDSDGNVASVTDPLGKVTTATTTGNTKVVTDPLGHITTRTIAADASGVTIAYSDDLGDQTTYTYNLQGELTGIVDPEDNSTTLKYDSYGGVTELDDPAGNVFTYTLDNFGNHTSFTAPNGSTLSFSYDDLAHLTRLSEALGHTEKYSYDAAGNLVQLTKPDLSVIQYAVDGNDHITQIAYPDGSTVLNQYDANGRLAQIQNALGRVSLIRDESGQIIKATGPFGNAVGYFYDASGNIIALAYPGGNTVTYTYDALNRMTSLTDWLGQTITYIYDAAGRHVETDYPNGGKTTYVYDNADRLISLSHKPYDNHTLAAYDFVRDKAGNVSQETRDEPLLPVLGDTAVNYTYNSENELTDIDGNAVTVDTNGNTTAFSGTTYAYNFDNRLTQVTRTDGQITYKYADDGLRYERSSNGTTTRYVLDLRLNKPRILAETDASGIITAYYVYGLGLAERIGANGDARFYHFDPRGNTVSLTDKHGKQTDAYAYGPYGRILNRLGSTRNPFTFLGQYGVTDEGAGLFYIHTRYYDANMGRFLSKDMNRKFSLTDAQNSNLYSYGKDNPLSNADISGKSPISLIRGDTPLLTHQTPPLAPVFEGAP